ncbi:MAG: helix-turn-helix transcriptional regulator [Bacteroidota bacterium]
MLHYTTHIGNFNYIPIALLVESVTLIVVDLKVRIISVVALSLIILNLGVDGLIELIVCEIVIAMMIYYLLEDAYLEFKKEISLNVFQIMLLTYFLRNALMIYCYYAAPVFLAHYYTWFLVATIIIPSVIAYLGPSKKIILGGNKGELAFYFKEEINVPSLKFISFQQNELLKELTMTEIRVLSLLAEGYNTKKICDTLFISKRTVYFHLQNLKGKLNLDSTIQLTKFALENRENLPKNQKPALLDSVKK